MPHIASKIPAALRPTGTDDWPAARPLPEFAREQLSQPTAYLLGLLVGRSLDHHPHERLGAAGAHQHAPPSLERVVRGAHGPMDVSGPLQRAAVANTHVDQAL